MCRLWRHAWATCHDMCILETCMGYPQGMRRLRHVQDTPRACANSRTRMGSPRACADSGTYRGCPQGICRCWDMHGLPPRHEQTLGHAWATPEGMCRLWDMPGLPPGHLETRRSHKSCRQAMGRLQVAEHRKHPSKREPHMLSSLDIGMHTLTRKRRGHRLKIFLPYHTAGLNKSVFYIFTRFRVSTLTLILYTIRDSLRVSGFEHLHGFRDQTYRLSRVAGFLPNATHLCEIRVVVALVGLGHLAVVPVEFCHKVGQHLRQKNKRT